MVLGLSSRQRKTIMKMRELAILALLAASAVPASAETVGNTISANAITANAITSNAITANAMSNNAITSNGLSAAGVHTGVGSVDDIIGVELPDGQTVTK
jgi:hypothetical protein